jgi:hypothetical protein
MRWWVPLLFFLLLPLGSAQEISVYEANLSITESPGSIISLSTEFNAQKAIYFDFLNNHEEELTNFSYPFNGRVEGLEISDSTGDLTYSSTYRSGRTYVTVHLKRPLDPNASRGINYRFQSSQVPTSFSRGLFRGDTYVLSTAHLLLANVRSFKFLVYLPEGYGIVEEEVTPKPTRVDSDGRRVILTWELKDPIPAELREFKAVVFFERFGDYRYVRYIFLFILVTIGLFYAYRYLREEGISFEDYLDRQKYLYEKIDILKEDEQAILKLIIEKDGIDQRDIQRQTDFSKTKVSKILSELEKRDTIRKEQVGRRNKIYLAKKLKET